MDDYIINEEMYQRVREVLGEYAHNWVFAAEGPDGSFYYDYSTPITGKALMANALSQMCEEEQYARLEVFSQPMEGDDVE